MRGDQPACLGAQHVRQRQARESTIKPGEQLIPGSMMPWKIVAPPGAVRSAQQGSLTAVKEITTWRGPWRAASGAGARCLRAVLCAVTGLRAVATTLPAG